MANTRSCKLNFARLRCDRQHPCGACSRRGLTNSCNYSTTASSSSATSNKPLETSTTDLHRRISELENLVVTLMQGQSLPDPRPAPTSPSPAHVFPEMQRPKKKSHDKATAPLPIDPGTLDVHESGTNYVQSVHWEAILTKIRGLKEDLATDSKPSPSESHFFYGPNRHATREEILAAVPARPFVDRLMALHFDSHIITPCQYTLRRS